MLPQAPEERRRRETQLQRAELLTLLRQHPEKQATEGGSLFREAHD